MVKNKRAARTAHTKEQLCVALYKTGLLIFRAVADPRNSGFSVKSREFPKQTQNPPEIFPNACRQNIFNTYLVYQTCFIHPKRPNLSWNFAKLTGVLSWINVVKNWALATMWNALPLVHFSSALLLKEQMIIPVKKMLNNAGHIDAKSESILAKFAKRKSSEIGCFLLIVSRRSFLPKFPVKSADISANFDFFPAKIPRNWPIFPRLCPWKSREILIFFSAKYQNNNNNNVKLPHLRFWRQRKHTITILKCSVFAWMALDVVQL